MLWNIIVVCPENSKNSVRLPYNFTKEEDAIALRDNLERGTGMAHKVIKAQSNCVLGFPSVIIKE